MHSAEDVITLMDEDPSDPVIVMVADAGATFLAPVFEDLATVVCLSALPVAIGIVSREYEVRCVMATVTDVRSSPRNLDRSSSTPSASSAFASRSPSSSTVHAPPHRTGRCS